MTLGDLILALMPPAGAIFVEWIDLLNDEALLTDATITLREEGQEEAVSDPSVIRAIIAKSTAGASEIAGLAPTFVSVFTSGFAILKEVEDWLWPGIAYLVSILLVALVVARLLHGYTYHAIAVRQRDYFRGRIFEKGFRRTRKQVVSYIIYAINGLLMLLALGVFCSTRLGQFPDVIAAFSKELSPVASGTLALVATILIAVKIRPGNIFTSAILLLFMLTIIGLSIFDKMTSLSGTHWVNLNQISDWSGKVIASSAGALPKAEVGGTVLCNDRKRTVAVCFAGRPLGYPSNVPTDITGASQDWCLYKDGDHAQSGVPGRIFRCGQVVSE